MKCYHLELLLSSGTKSYHLGLNVIIWDENLIIWRLWFHLDLNVIIWDETLSSGANVIIWDYMLSSGTTCYHLG
jgi:hypothetical protein